MVREANMIKRDRIHLKQSVRSMVVASALLVLILGTFPAASIPAGASNAAPPGARPAPQVVDADCVDFESLSLGTTYNVGAVFFDSRTRVDVRPFTWADGFVDSSGSSWVEGGELAGGTGNEMRVNKVNLSFNFGVPLRELTLLFGEYGGNLNIQINGVFRNFFDMTELDGTTISGVAISVVNGMGNDTGLLQLTGRTSDFAIGGQELWIDDVCVVRTARLMLPLVFK
jgi:hypothetical protein